MVIGKTNSHSEMFFLNVALHNPVKMAYIRVRDL